MQTAKKLLIIADGQKSPEQQKSPLLFYGMAASCAFAGFTQEFLLASYASFLMGSALLQYALVMCAMLASVGAGAWWCERRGYYSATVFIGIQIVSCFLSILSLPIMYYEFHLNLLPAIWLIAIVGLVGLGVGFQIPVLRSLGGFENRASGFMFCVYAGGFLGGTLFPLWLLPTFGFFGVSGVVAVANAFLSLVFATQLRAKLEKDFALWCSLATFACLAAITFLITSNHIREWLEFTLFGIQHV